MTGAVRGTAGRRAWTLVFPTTSMGRSLNIGLEEVSMSLLPVIVAATLATG